jgi:phosphatidylglycerol:prolipoprotein diacylglycerol transferase
MYPVIHIGSFSFYTFGLAFGTAICVGWVAFDQYFKRHNIHVNMPVLGICLILSGWLGAKLDSTLVTAIRLHLSSDWFTAHLGDLSSGYTYLGCLLAGSLAGVVYAKVNRIPLRVGFDSIFCIGLGYGVGRIGCFLAGDGDYGIPSSLPWAVSFPHGLVPTMNHVHPTMLYSTVWELCVFAVLWKISDPKRGLPLRPGVLMGCYLIATSTGRFLVEYLSLNPILSFGLKEAQIVSVALMLTGAGILVYSGLQSRDVRDVSGAVVVAGD